MSRLPTEIRRIEGKAGGVNCHLIFFSTSWPQSGVQIKLRGLLGVFFVWFGFFFNFLNFFFNFFACCLVTFRNSSGNIIRQG